jgi:hypothetical protein
MAAFKNFPICGAGSPTAVGCCHLPLADCPSGEARSSRIAAVAYYLKVGGGKRKISGATAGDAVRKALISYLSPRFAVRRAAALDGPWQASVNSAAVGALSIINRPPCIPVQAETTVMPTGYGIEGKDC